MSQLSGKVIDYCREIAGHSEEPGRTTRTFLSAPVKGVHELLKAWMERLGMTVWVDAAGNLRGVHGSGSRRLILASHLDTVPDAGAFDGVLGVVIGIALVEALGSAPPDLSIEVIGFSEEEGVKFGIPFIGSRALCGTLDERVLDAGVGAAIRDFGLDPEELPAASFAHETIGYLEFHIEQGPVLESLDFPLGIVARIAGQSRLNLTFNGRANHAGTTPMNLRRDALTAAAAWIGCVEAEARKTDGLVATVGSIRVEPNATNVIAGLARVSLDVRHGHDEIRRASVDRMIAFARDVCGRRGISLEYEHKLDQAAVAMDIRLTEVLAQSVAEANYSVHRMTSGAGHDAMIVAAHLPAAMLFLRSPGGVSHHPDESVITEDIDAAIEVGLRFLRHV